MLSTITSSTDRGPARADGPRPAHRDLALALYRARRARDVDLPGTAELWRDHAWDMLLDLFVAAEEGRTLDVKSACLGGCVAPTTGLRVIDRLVAAGLVRRSSHPGDRRKSMLTLTAEGAVAMRRHLDRIDSR